MIYLASRSPRRRELLGQIGVRFHLLLFRDKPGRALDVDETPLEGEAPDVYVQRLARLKAEVAWQRMLQRRLPAAPVLAADTTVTHGGQILGKPADRAEAEAMLAALSGTTHEVLTAVALKDAEWLQSALSRSAVTFKRLSGEEIREYVASGECDDKAGAYGVQGRAAKFVMELRGSYSGVMGLPLYETAELLAAHERRNPR
jgi:septum formation protein